MRPPFRGGFIASGWVSDLELVGPDQPRSLHFAECELLPALELEILRIAS